MRKPPPNAHQATAAGVSTNGTILSRTIAIRATDEQERTESDSSEKDGKNPAHEPNTPSGGLKLINIVVRPVEKIPGIDFSPAGNNFGGTDRRSTHTNATSPERKGNRSQDPEPADGTSFPDPTDAGGTVGDMNNPTHGFLKKPASHNGVAPVNPRRDSSDTCSTARDTCDSDRQTDDGVGRCKGEAEKSRTGDVFDNHGEGRTPEGGTVIDGDVLELVRHTIRHAMKRVVGSRNKVGVELGSDAVPCSAASGHGSIDRFEGVRGTPEGGTVVDGSIEKNRNGHVLQLARHATRHVKKQITRRQNIEVVPGRTTGNGDDGALDSVRHAIKHPNKGVVGGGKNAGFESSSDVVCAHQHDDERQDVFVEKCTCTVM